MGCGSGLIQFLPLLQSTEAGNFANKEGLSPGVVGHLESQH